MTANINRTNTQTPKRVLMVAANPSTSTVTQWPVGFWWAELTHPYWAFVEAGYEVEIRSPEGGALAADGFSDPEDDSGYSADDILSLGFKRSAKHRGLIEDTKSIADVNPAHYDAVFFVGGQSPMFTFRGNAAVQRLVAAFYEAGKVTALVCHATCALLETTLSDGTPLVAGKTWTGFANAEEQFADSFVGQRIQPFWIEDEARALEGTNFVVDQAFREYAVRDGLLVTGQQQFSGAAAARLVIEAIGR
ncbi:ThiJ/PfpI [Plesiocystis pacifica SIR-1]|uniref:ThiJ/PfpI n=1 Tax=Plesiocystis pacifica SIR-1 TaxID=391625 RepID=A6FY22_9BACT|nr:type 1 glutamine amidotransferase domain-containing protein [Plesiocystis pacifica]EDM81401.1 ThiJ/PfpI [Plesiocystis pacifica SIR-1]